MPSVKIAFLYSEVAGYFLACAAELSKRAEVLIFRWPVNKEAPFDLTKYKNLTILDRSKFDQDQLEDTLLQFQPDLVVCSGWLDKGYLIAAKKFKRQIPVIVSIDNHWTGSVKQRIAALVSPLHLKKTFTHAWVPGKPQAVFAEKLGFRDQYLLKNFYCADVELFKQQYEATFHLKEKSFPKRFLYVARYVKHKGIYEMWQAFLELQKEMPNEWELWCLGTGEEWEKRVEGEKIRHFGFVQPTEMQQYIEQTGVYILPSTFEPWGVSVQEFAICGFPLLLSGAVGAKWGYLREDENGLEFKQGSVEAIKDAMKKMVETPDHDLCEMGQKSHAIGISFTPQKWADNLLSILK